MITIDATLGDVHRHSIIGSRIQIPVHFDLWMRGAMYGVITSVRHGRNGHSDYVNVKMDNPRIRRRVKVSKLDWGYCRLIDLPFGGKLRNSGE